MLLKLWINTLNINYINNIICWEIGFCYCIRREKCRQFGDRVIISFLYFFLRLLAYLDSFIFPAKYSEIAMFDVLV